MPKFLLQANGQPVGCAGCKCTLSYPAIQIPDGPPVYHKESEVLGKWSWKYKPYCLGCAKKAIKRLKPADLEPVIGKD